MFSDICRILETTVVFFCVAKSESWVYFRGFFFTFSDEHPRPFIYRDYLSPPPGPGEKTFSFCFTFEGVVYNIPVIRSLFRYKCQNFTNCDTCEMELGEITVVII